MLRRIRDLGNIGTCRTIGIFLIVIIVTYASSEDDAERKLHRTERNVFTLVAMLETYWHIGDQSIPYTDPGEVKSPIEARKWGLTERERGRADFSDFRTLGAIHDPQLPDSKMQLDAFNDPFREDAELDYVGHPGYGWYLIRSAGPDQDIDLPIDKIDPKPALAYWDYRGLNDPLTCFQYDPTNGTSSSGDLLFWRDAHWNTDLAIRHLPPSIKGSITPPYHLWDLH